MPIYGYGVTKAPWTIETEMKKKKLIKLKKIIIQARESFAYSHDQVFCNSIKCNLNLDELYIASYDMSKTNMPVGNYQVELESLIQEANFILSKDNSFKNHKFDIIGNWTMGKIIIMVKK